MLDQPVVIFTAARPQQAQLLKNLLADRGILAVLLNDALQSAVGEVPFGWATSVRVAVRESDAAVAREMALEFESQLGEADEYTTVDEAGSESGQWPKCPSCQHPRQTTCPICQTSGSDFEIGDSPGDNDAGASPDNPLAIISVTGSMLVICPTCDEPFVPKYLRRCEWCSYDFGEGTQLSPRSFAKADLEMNSRALLLLAATAVLVAGLLFWFGSLVPD